MLELDGVRFVRGAFDLDVSLALREGETGVVLGASGCGKSTLLRLIAGFIKPGGGTVRLGGRRIDTLPPEKRRIGMVFQGDALFPAMSARANIEYGPRIAGVAATERRLEAEALANSLGMGALLDRMPRSLSGGERQRVALARTLAAKPHLLLFDEALSSLDPESRRSLASEISLRTRKAGLGSLHVTHDVGEALELADRIFMMDRGRIVEQGAPKDLYESPSRAITARFFGGGPLIPITGRAGECWRCEGGALFSRPPSEDAREGLEAGNGFLYFPSAMARRISAGSFHEGEPGVITARVASIAYRGARTEILSFIPGTDVAFRFELAADSGAAVDDLLAFRIPPSSTRVVR